MSNTAASAAGRAGAEATPERGERIDDPAPAAPVTPATSTLAVRRPGPLLTLATFAALAVLFFAALGRPPLFEPDEGRYAEIPRAMLASGDLLTPRLDGVLYFEKPPLYYWLNAAAIAVLGLTETACRFWSALLGLAGTGLAYLLARSMRGPVTGLAAAVILGTSPLYWTLSRLNTIDMTLSFFIGAALTCAWLALRDPARRRPYWLGCSAAVAMALLAKGLVGALVPVAVVGLFILLTRRFRELTAVPWVGATLVLLLIAAPWHVLVGLRHPSFFWFYFVHEHVLRYTTLSAERWEPVWYFLPIVTLGLLPWTGLLAGALRILLGRGGRPLERDGARFLALWAGFVLLFFSASKSKLLPYVLPLALPLAVLAALAFADLANRAQRPPRALRLVVGAGGALLAVLALALAVTALGLTPSVTLPPGLAPGVAPAALVAALAAAAMAAFDPRRRPAAWAATGGLSAAALFAALVLAAPALAERHSAKALAEALQERARPDDRVACFGDYIETLPPYLGRPVDVADFRGELEFGIDHLDPVERLRRFPTTAELVSRWGTERRIFLVARDRRLERLRRELPDLGPVLFHTGDLNLFSNQPERGAAVEPHVLP